MSAMRNIVVSIKKNKTGDRIRMINVYEYDDNVKEFFGFNQKFQNFIAFN